MRSRLRLPVAVAVMAFADASLGGHHSPSIFDQRRDLTLEAVVTRMAWANPHVDIYVAAQDENGEPAAWVVEAQSPRVMELFGWTRTSLAAGDRVTLLLNPARDGTKSALGRSVVRRDGTTLRIPWQPNEIRDALRAESRK
jgi:hypothetical protein